MISKSSNSFLISKSRDNLFSIERQMFHNISPSNLSFRSTNSKKFSLAWKDNNLLKNSAITCKTSLSSNVSSKVYKLDLYSNKNQKLKNINFESLPSPSQKYINFLQFLFYKEFTAQKNKSNIISSSNLNSDQNSLKKIQISSLENKNDSHFFPYRKGWINYWLLPFMGFLSSISFKSKSDYILMEFHPFYSNKVLNPFTKPNKNTKTRINNTDFKLINNSSSIFQVPISDIQRLEFLPLDFLRKHMTLNSNFLEAVDKFFDLWLDNSSFLQISLRSNSLGSQLNLNVSGNQKFLSQFSNLNSSFLNQDSDIYALKFYHVPIYNNQQKNSFSINLEKNLTQSSKKMESFNEIKTLLNSIKDCKSINSKMTLFNSLKKITYRPLHSSIFSYQFFQKNEKITSSFTKSLIGIHLKEGIYKSNPDFVNALEKNQTASLGSKQMKLNNNFFKRKNTPLKDYKQASLILDQFYSEIESLKNLKSQEQFQEIISSSNKGKNYFFQNNQSNPTEKSFEFFFKEKFEIENFGLYYPNSFNQFLKKNLLLISLQNSSEKLLPTIVPLIQNNNKKNLLSHNHFKLNIIDSSNNHRKNYKFLEHLIQYFHSKDSLNFKNEISYLPEPYLKSNDEISKSKQKYESLKSAKKLTKTQLYSIILDALNKNLVKTIEVQPSNFSNDLSEGNVKESNNYNSSELQTKAVVAFPNLKLNLENTKKIVLKLAHPLVFTNPSNPHFQEIHENFSSILNFPSSKLNQSYEKIQRNHSENEFYATNLNSIPKNSELTPPKKTKFSHFSPQELFLKPSKKSGLNKEKIISKNQYSSNYINFLCFKIQRRMLNQLGSNIGHFSIDSNSKSINNFRLEENENIQNNKSNVEKIFRSYLSKKQEFLKTSLQKSKIQPKDSLFHLKKQSDNKKKKISHINSFLQSKLRENLSVNFESAQSRNIVKKRDLNISINSLLKNRAFILKSNSINSKNRVSSSIMKQIETVDSTQTNSSYFDKLEKRKYLQKKYRRKKQRKETRRRKKRKRFYPRPTWVRFKTYTSLLKQLSSKKQKNQKFRSSFSTFNSIHLGSSNFVNNLSLHSTKDFYKIKTSVLGELKRSFWKSYWLRSNLKPYLTRIKSDLNKIKDIGIQQTVKLNTNDFISIILGLKENQCLTEKQSKSSQNSLNLFLHERNKISQVNESFDLNKWQLITQIAQHNQIMYERIQNLIINIRENLNINGQFKARPYKHLTREKLKNLISLKQNNLNNPNNDFWVKLEKNKVVRSLFQTSYKYYGSYSNYRLLWAINKSNLGEYKSVNKVKDLWMNTKNRDQSKANKTKKIIYQVSQNYKFFIEQSIINNPKFKFSEATTKDNVSQNSNLLRFSYLTPTINCSFATQEDKPASHSHYYDELTSIEKCLKISERKLKQKQQKLRLTLGVFNNFNIHEQTLKFTRLNSKKLERKAQFLIPSQQKSYTNEYKYWWNETKIQTIPVLKSVSISENSKIPVWVSTFLFHFCTLISLISLSQVRDVIKFLLILVSKISKIYFEFLYYSFNSLVEFSKKLIPSKSNESSFFESNSLYYKTFKFKSIFSKESSLKMSLFQKALNLESDNSTKTSFKNQKQFNQSLKHSTKLYLIFLSFLKTPLVVFQLADTTKKNSKAFESNNLKTLTKSTSFSLKFKLNQTFIKLFFYSTLSSLVFSLKNFSFLTYSYFLKTLNFVEMFIRSVYSFFEKPGELIVDWIAYLFLVEWASDLTTTIPDTIDTSLSYSISKYSRSIRFPLSSVTNGTSNLLLSLSGGASNFILVPSVSSLPSLNWYSNLASFPFITFLGGSLLQRRIYSMYELLLMIGCRPDTDLLIRQQKGQVFWDSWSDLLIEVAEKSNINISELSNLKEEQNRLLEQLLVVTKVENLKSLPKFKSNPSLLKKKEKDFNYISNVIFKPLDSNYFLINNLKSNVLLDSQNLALWKRWSTNQFLSYQGKDTELFIDLHPPKSFAHLTSIKYSQSIQQPIGLVLCQIFSGIFYKQISKNLLVVGPAGNEKSLLIQAIAGETELKIITDNAYRYAMVFRGVAVGIKLLRDVFEALTLHTPCIFLLEDIHAIGERRPLLISDDENTKGTESSFSTEREEVHEKNQVIYQLTKHIISHYKKPYKGDFSLLIPTNHFCFDLYNSVGFNEKQSQTNLSLLSPISLTNKTTTDLVASPKDKQNKDRVSDLETNMSFLGSKKLSSALQIQKNQLLAPPATSPFSVLVLKEEKKFKPKKLVKELPWSGLPGEQFANISKSTYSIRVKVALLADSVLSNLSVKLDMITDLLVIIDSVKGNRGFVVFATTHVPYILDPALRRPGRFDETLSLPQIPNLLSRWEVLNSKNSVWQLSKSNQSLVKKYPISNITKTRLLKNKRNIIKSKSLALGLNYQEPFSVYPLGVSFSPWESYKLKNIWAQNSNLAFINDYNKIIPNASSFSSKENSTEHQKSSLLVYRNYSLNSSNFIPNKLKNQVKSLELIKLNQLNLQKIYSIVSQILLSVQFSGYCNSKSKNYIWGDFSLSISNLNLVLGNQGVESSFYSTFNRAINLDSLVYMSLYSPPHIFKQHLTILMAGQIGQTIARSFGVQKVNSKFSINNSKKIQLKGLEPTLTNSWKAATSLVYAFIQKRIIYQKKLIVPRFLNFGLEGSKPDIPSPPASNILLPAKRYENYKRTFTVSQLKYKTQLSIGEKIQIHQQQRLVKRLYKIPLKNYFRSEILNSFKNSLSESLLNSEIQLMTNNANLNNFTTFSNAAIILAPLDKSLSKPTNINWYFRNRILTRHQTYLSNQWWNGQLQEHNTESTFLSDIDWRYSYFITQVTDGNIGDLFIDFPDSEQYYNPKNQRWINTSGSWNSLFDLEKNVYNHCSEHYIYECFMEAFKYLNENRELLDFYVINIFEKGINTRKEFNDMEILETFKRFSGFSKF